MNVSHKALMSASALLLVGGCATTPCCTDGLAPRRMSEFAPSAQGHAALAADGCDRMLMVWDSRRQQGGKYGILGRFVNASGAPASREFTINTHVTEHQMHPAVAMTVDGQAWVTWQSWAQDGDDWSVVARHFDGAHWGDELSVNMRRDGSQDQPVVAMHPDGRALVVWIDTQQHGTVMGRLMTPAGPVGTSFVVSNPMHDDKTPSVAVQGGEFVVVWGSTHDDARRVAGRSIAIDGGMTPIVTLASDAIEPCLASNGESISMTWLQRGEHGWDVAAMDVHGVRHMVQAAMPGRWLTGPAIALSDTNDMTVAWTIDKPVHEVHHRTMRAQGGWGDSAVLLAKAHLEPLRGTQRLHIAGNGALHAAASGAAGGDKKATALISTGSSGSACWPVMDLPAPDLTYARVASATPIPPVWDPNFVPQPRSREARPQRGDHGFEGITNTGWNPPDPDLAAGPNHVVEVTNGGIAAFTHAGQLLWQEDIENPTGFWGEVGATYFVFDPEALYDERSGRFFVMANERSDDGGSYFLLGVSSTSDPTDPWHKYRLNMSHIDDDIDSPNMAVDEDTVYLSCDMFGPDKYPILMVPKAQVLAGDPVSGATEIMLSGSGNQSLGLARSTDDDPDVPQFMLQSSEGTNNGVDFDEIRLHAIIDPLGDPYRETYDLPVPTYEYPSQVPQDGSSSQFYLFEPRFWSCVYRNGRIWAVHHVNSDRARVRWYDIDMRGWPTSGQTPTLASSGEIDMGAGIYTFFPAIAVDADDNVAIVFARSADDEYPSMWRTVRAAGDAAGTFQPPQLVKASVTGHSGGRWGDYAGASPDPANGAIWLAHEWRAAGGWSTWIDRAQVVANAPVHVPGDYATIQAAIDDVPNGFTIIVAPGTYTEQLELSGRSLVLMGSGPADTVLDAANGGLAISLEETTTGMVIEGFTITRGSGALGGNVLAHGSQAVIRDCHITHGAGTYGGGIMSVQSPALVVQDCLFCSNTPDHIFGQWT
ncbi:MAG: hypothetical protein MK074_06950, partial [Phycisphaerales bacterium]|nr:hypothetical protein [Phycisphaerales bacterium]